MIVGTVTDRKSGKSRDIREGEKNCICAKAVESRLKGTKYAQTAAGLIIPKQ